MSSIFGKEMKRLDHNSSLSKAVDKKKENLHDEEVKRLLSIEASISELVDKEIAIIVDGGSPEELKEFALANLSSEIIHECIEFLDDAEEVDYEIPSELIIPPLLKDHMIVKLIIWFDCCYKAPIVRVAIESAIYLRTNRGDNFQQIYADLIKGVAILYFRGMPLYEEYESEDVDSAFD